MLNVRQDIGLDRDRPYIEGSPILLRCPIYISGLSTPAQITGFSARWTLRPVIGFSLGDPILSFTTDDATLTNDGDEILIQVEQGQTTGNRHMHRHELWINNGNSDFPVLYGDFYITPSPMAPGQE